MKLVDELFEMYQNRLTGDDEDLDIITYAVLEESDRNDLIKIVEEMNDEELQYFISIYLIETLREKFSNSSIDIHPLKTKYLH
ncbi:DUF6154 family protein [Heyndrickxia sp. NPDC080065]|uniref:DUF6154 family protein n=1 Tax=Heyndrickxia sp. NPDC080065 TaxID=3390568 RepID=UPI003CFD7FC0